MRNNRIEWTHLNGPFRAAPIAAPIPRPAAWADRNGLSGRTQSRLLGPRPTTNRVMLAPAIRAVAPFGNICISATTLILAKQCQLPKRGDPERGTAAVAAIRANGPTFAVFLSEIREFALCNGCCVDAPSRAPFARICKKTLTRYVEITERPPGF